MITERDGRYARIIEDTITRQGVRCTTMQAAMWRPMLAELNTHAFSRNSESSRAVPFPLRVETVISRPVGPLLWKAEQRGMQAGEELPEHLGKESARQWRKASRDAAKRAQRLAKLGVHKSIVNRLLEPFLLHTVCITSCTWQNFFDQRCSPQAQDDIRIPAEMMREAYDASTPRLLEEGEWHLPYVGADDHAWAKQQVLSIEQNDPMVGQVLAALSASRCAQLSYLTQPEFDPVTGAVTRAGGKVDPARDMQRFERLMSARPRHWSPLEHPAMAFAENLQSGELVVPGRPGPDPRPDSPIQLGHRSKVGKLPGYLPYRSIFEAQEGDDTYR